MGGRGVKRKKIRRSTRIQDMLPTQDMDTEKHVKSWCAACDSNISHKSGNEGVVGCIKCPNMFHPVCSGIQDGWIGHFKFQCSILEIECGKHTKWIKRRKRGSRDKESDMKNITSGNTKHESQGPNANVN